MSLLSICQDIADTVGVPRPTAIVSSVDLNVRRILAALQREGISLQRRYHWQATIKEATFTTVATESQGLMETLAPGYDDIVNESAFNRSREEPLFGPLNATEWQARKASTIAGPSNFFRIRNNLFLTSPVPAAGETWAFEYYSRYFCQSSGGTPQVRWLADNDVGILDEELMTKGGIWRWKQSNGLDYAEDMNAYEYDVAIKMAQDGGKPRIDIGGDGPDFSGDVRTPEGSWPL